MYENKDKEEEEDASQCAAMHCGYQSANVLKLFMGSHLVVYEEFCSNIHSISLNSFEYSHLMVCPPLGLTVLNQIS